jgi:pimeloyl-ACP methyl ester carboxylesterase
MNELAIPQGRIRYRDEGSGDPIVFVHGFLVDGELWRDVAARLSPDFRVIVPDWPMGSHELALGPGADLSPPGMARIVAAFLDGLGLQDVTLVGNDSGGAICQLVAVNHPQRVARLVLTSCDAYENFPPPAFRPLQGLARIPGAVGLILQSMRAAFARRTPTAYGWVMKRADDALTKRWVTPALRDRAVRRDATEFLLGMNRRHTLAAARRFGEFDRPVLVAWSREDRFFKVRFAERLAKDFPAARLEFIDDAYTFAALDQPTRTAELIASFARSATGEAGRPAAQPQAQNAAPAA